MVHNVDSAVTTGWAHVDRWPALTGASAGIWQLSAVYDGGVHPLIKIVDDWAGYVLQLDPASNPERPPETLGATDLVPALQCRDAIERILVQLGSLAPDNVLDIVAAIDAFYRILTEPDPDVSSPARASAPQGWWWSRIPHREGLHGSGVAGAR